MQGYRIGAALIVLAGIGLGFFAFQSEGRFPYRLGLDLAGGSLLTYRADVSTIAESEVDASMESLRDVIERRVNLFGVSEPIVQTTQPLFAGGEERLIVELPGVTDVDAAVEALGETPVLDFRLLTATTSPGTTTPGFLYEPTGLTGRFLSGARIEFSGGSPQSIQAVPVVAISFNEEGAKLFEEITSQNIGQILAIFLDGVPITEPVIQSAITDGQAIITGSFTAEEARDLARDLNFGALPVPIELVSVNQVGAVLGDETLDHAITAGLWSFLVIGLFLTSWYRLPGFLAVVALTFYVMLTLSLFKVLSITLTAAGIAGFILSIGMAVDANILVFERFKEELRAGKTIKDAIEVGFSRAWLSIRDGNLTTIFSAVILFYATTSLVRGFALTLGIGVLISMFSALTVTRTLLNASVPGADTPRGRKLFDSGLSRPRS